MRAMVSWLNDTNEDFVCGLKTSKDIETLYDYMTNVCECESPYPDWVNVHEIEKVLGYNPWVEGDKS